MSKIIKMKLFNTILKNIVRVVMLLIGEGNTNV